MSKVRLKADVEFLWGHLRYGHFELVTDENDIKDLSPDELKTYLEESGTIIIDEYRVEDYGALSPVKVEKV